MISEKRLFAALLVWLTGLIGQLSQTTLQAQNINSGLKAYWNMDAVSGTVIADQSGNGFNGTLSGNAIINASGKVNGCLEMPTLSDGMMLVSNMNWQPAAPGYAFSVSFWINPYSLTNYSNQVVAYPGWGAFVFHGDATGGIYTGTDQTNRFTPGYFPTNILQTNQWQHFVFTYASGTGTLYRNGIQLTSRTGMTAPTAWTGFRIGASSASSSLHGKIDEVRVYDRAVTAAEVELLWSYPSAPAGRVWSSTPVNTDWNNPSNWTGGVVPQEYDNVTVNSCTTCPALASNVTVNNLSIGANGKLNIGGFTMAVVKNLSLSSAFITSNAGRLTAGNPYSINTSYTGQITIVKSYQYNVSSYFPGGNTFSGGKTTLIMDPHRSYVRWFLGYNSPDTFNEDVQIDLNGSPDAVYHNIQIGYWTNQQPLVFKKNLTVNVTGYQAVLGGWSVRCDGNLQVNQSTVQGSFTLQGDVELKGNIAFSYIQPTFSGHSPSGGFGLMPAAGKKCLISGAISLSSNVTNGIPKFQFGETGTTQIGANSTLVVGALSQGMITLSNVQVADRPGGWNLLVPGSTGTVVLNNRTTFAGDADITTPRIQLSGSVFNGEVKIRKTGPGTDASAGGNIFRKKVTITNNAPAGSHMQMATSADDIIQQTQ